MLLNMGRRGPVGLCFVVLVSACSTSDPGGSAAAPQGKDATADGPRADGAAGDTGADAGHEAATEPGSETAPEPGPESGPESGPEPQPDAAPDAPTDTPQCKPLGSLCNTSAQCCSPLACSAGACHDVPEAGPEADAESECVPEYAKTDSKTGTSSGPDLVLIVKLECEPGETTPPNWWMGVCQESGDIKGPCTCTHIAQTGVQCAIVTDGTATITLTIRCARDCDG